MDTVRLLKMVVASLLPPPPLTVQELVLHSSAQQPPALSGGVDANAQSHATLVEILGWFTIRPQHWNVWRGDVEAWRVHC